MIRIQNLQYPNNQICGVRELYLHEDGDKLLFDGYFNLLYLEKRQKYTDIDRLYVKIKASGFRTLSVCHNRKAIVIFPLDSSAEKEYCFMLPYLDYPTGIFYVEAEKDQTQTARVLEGAFFAESNKEERQVNIGIDICTYKREAYVERNLNQLKSGLLDQNQDRIGDHVRIYVVDNGKTLESFESVQELVQESNGKIRVFPNKNVGGAGGFTRGMLEILDDKHQFSLTHVLLIDDDAIIDPESVVRLYGFLTLLKDGWKNMTVGGAMMREDYPYALFCAGEWWENGRTVNPKLDLDLRTYEAATDPYLTETGHEYDRYSGWWCCCYSLVTVREDNLPIPLFIHHDDIEYGLRNAGQGIAFLNGIGVWHKGIETSFRGANLYYDVRNKLIDIALYSENKKNIAKNTMKNVFAISIFMFRYQDAFLAYQGFLDFLKGPRWLVSQNPDKLNLRIRKDYYQMLPLEEILKKLPEQEIKNVRTQIAKFWHSQGISRMKTQREEKAKHKWFEILTLNGMMFPHEKYIKVVFPDDPPYVAYRRYRVLQYEPLTKKAVLLFLDYKKIWRVIITFFKVEIALCIKFRPSTLEWQREVHNIETATAWKKILQ